MDVKLLLGGLALAGVGVGAYALLNRSAATKSPSPGTSQPAPALPSPYSPTTPPIADAGDLMCAQVVTKCADGSWASTPCGCRDRGGVAKPDPATVIYEPQPMPAPEVIAVAGGSVQAIEPMIAPPTVQVYSDIDDRPIWDRSEGPLWS